MNHNDLIDIGIKWLQKPYKNCSPIGHAACSVVLNELVTQAQEIPDAIGFSGDKTIVLEAKTSLSDFRADAKKAWRIKDSLGMGALRYYICVDGLIPVDEVSDNWGLLYVKNNIVSVIKDSKTFEERQWKKEMMMLLSYIRRIKR